MRATPVTLMLILAGCGEQKLGVYNAAPVVSISAPTDGSDFDEGTMVDFTGLVSDAGTAPEALTLEWSSDIDQVLSATEIADSTGQVLFSTASLSYGNHAITLAATDEQGERAEYTIAVTINDVPNAPEIFIVHPVGGEHGVEGEEFEFVVTVSDEQQAPETLAVTMESDVDGTFCQPTADSIGVATCDQVLSPGDHRLSFRVVDDERLAAVEEYYFSVTLGTEIDDDGDGWTETQGDCDDGDASVNPNATEYYNERDDDCDGLTDDGTVGFDDDGDGQSELDGDCDDGNASTYIGATEVCDGLDNDCDRIIDETTTCYDDDGDGVTEIDGDCDDASGISYPGAAEVEDALDNDCDGIVDEGTAAYDDDFDGYTENAGDCDDANGSINPAGTESCDGYDNDCSGDADEENAVGCFTYYYDYDGDGYGSGTVSSHCLCGSSGSYTAASNTDCYDYNGSASPAATTYSTSQRGDGSYDWNCDGTASKYYPSSGSCYASWGGCDATHGWSGSPAACGASGTYLDDNDDCDLVWFSCEVNGAGSYTQPCL